MIQQEERDLGRSKQISPIQPRRTIRSHATRSHEDAGWNCAARARHKAETDIQHQHQLAMVRSTNHESLTVGVQKSGPPLTLH